MHDNRTKNEKFNVMFQGDNVNENRLSYLDVKCLYDAAYEEQDKARASLKNYQDLMRQAEKMEAAYRAQIAADCIARYQTKAA